MGNLGRINLKQDNALTNIDTKTFTFQTRLRGEHPQLDQFACLFGRLERKLYVDRVHRKTDLNTLKSSYIAQYGITARQFNALRISVDGKISAVMELLKLAVDEYKQRITSQIARINKLSADIVNERAFISSSVIPKSRKTEASRRITQYKFRLHQAKRKLKKYRDRLAGIEHRIKTNNPKLCFGSNKLFRDQFGLDKASEKYNDAFAKWQADWSFSRNNAIYVIGSKDETCGNVSCQVKRTGDNTFSLNLRLPEALSSDFGKFFRADFEVSYGFEAIIEALNASEIINTTSTNKLGEEKSVRRRTGVAMTYRFHKDKKGWRLLISVPVTKNVITDKKLGMIGVDLNADHLAVVETDRFGNMVDFKRFDLNLDNKTTAQRQAIIGDAAKAISTWAAEVQKPIALEDLDFTRKKRELGFSEDQTYNRMLSSLAYTQIHTMLSASAFRAQVEVNTVNPAYTSLIGNVNYAKRYGISGHLGAALAIARRAQHFREDPIIDTNGKISYQYRDNHHVTLSPPVRKRSKHVWSLWSSILTAIKRPLAEGKQRCKSRASLQKSKDVTRLFIESASPHPASSTVRLAYIKNPDDQVLIY